MIRAFETMLGSLVRIPTVAENIDAKRNVVDWTAKWLVGHSIDATLYDHPSSPSIVACTDPHPDPVLFLVHLDVIPAHPSQFTLSVDGSIATGRGTIDDKGPAVLLLLLLDALRNRPDITVPVRAAFTTDEETGSHNGTRRLLQLGALGNPRAVIVLDGGDGTSVVHREKGGIFVTIEASGRTSHGAYPWDGDNAIDKIVRTIDRIKRGITSRASNHRPSDAHWHPTVNIGTIQGGQQVNQVPASAQAQIDIRFPLPHTTQEMIALVEQSLEEGVLIRHLALGDPFETSADHPVIGAYATCMQQALHHPIELGGEHGASDGRFFAAANVPVLLHRPRGGGAHTDREWIDMHAACDMLNGLLSFLSWFSYQSETDN